MGWLRRDSARKSVSLEGRGTSAGARVHGREAIRRQESVTFRRARQRVPDLAPAAGAWYLS